MVLWVGHIKQRTKGERRMEHVRVRRMSKRTVARGQTGHGSFNSAAKRPRQLLLLANLG